jgi:hypothetical protein
MAADMRHLLPAELRMHLNGFYLYGIKQHCALPFQFRPVLEYLADDTDDFTVQVTVALHHARIMSFHYDVDHSGHVVAVFWFDKQNITFLYESSRPRN